VSSRLFIRLPTECVWPSTLFPISEERRSYGGDRDGGRGGYGREERRGAPDRDALPDRPSASFGDSGTREKAPVPDKPPFTMYIGNLPFSVDEDAVANFFDGLEVKEIRLITDEMGRSRGYGYVEFGNKGALEQALSADGDNYFGRPMRLDVATDRGSGGRRGEPTASDTSSDWRRDDRKVPERDERRGGGGWGDRDDRRGGFERDDRRGGYERDDRREDRGGYGDRDRRGGYDRPSRSDGAWTRDDTRAEVRDERRGRDDRRGGYGDRHGGFDRDAPRGPPRDSAPRDSAPRERKKLVLKKRSADVPVGGRAATSGKADPFGGTSRHTLPALFWTWVTSDVSLDH
jgi:translation initiation factor 4B